MVEWVIKAISKTTVNSETGCWEYSGEIVHNGYGRVNNEGKNVRVHRLSYSFFKGKIPEGFMVCHHCDVRNCWNPDHLFAGTAEDNSRDMITKGRARKGTYDRPRGEASTSSKLTEFQVLEILREAENGASLRALGKRFGICKSHVGAIVRGEKWSHLQRPAPTPEASAGTMRQ